MTSRGHRNRAWTDPTDASRPPRRIRIGLTLGDLNGIGPETALLAAQAIRMGRFPDTDLVLIGSPSALAPQASALGLICPPPIPSLLRCPLSPSSSVRIWDPTPSLAPAWQPGRITAEASQAACAWIGAAIEACLRNELDAMVTGPICKEGFSRAGLPYPGHTELLEERTRAASVAMMLVGGPLRVLLATRHIPLRAVPDAITPDGLRTTFRFAAQAMTWLGVTDARIGVCGLNPHAGDGGAIGDEDLRIIAPAIREARALGIPVEGPLAGDSVFHQAVEGRYDGVVAMYHDQGLAPLKLVGFRDGVNLTLGLPIVRTSPAHGTAFDMAGRGRASADSLFSAIRMAASLARRPSPWQVAS